METNNFSLRELNFGNNRHKIMKEFLTRLTTQSINDIYVEDVCKAVGISKVTFFHYFHSKEEIVHYFILGWEYARSYEAINGLFHGRQGIEHIFKSISQEAFAQNLMLSLTQFLSKTECFNLQIAITGYEYSRFHSQAYQQKIRPMNIMEVMSHYVCETTFTGKNDDLCTMLLTLLYGAPLAAKCIGNISLGELYEKDLTLLLFQIEDHL
jgi:AcrR family transcriptional regulator